MSIIRTLLLKSQKITATEFSDLCERAEILEHDPRGIKVIQLKNNDIFKVFRLRNKLSSARYLSYAKRFARNAIRLEKLGIATVSIKTIYHFEDSTDTAVLYAALPGQTIKQVLKADEMNSQLAAELGAFIARLHHLGVHFRSLHMGNIVLTPKGKLGLIDISDLSIYKWPLFYNTRVRSFKHICRYPEDIETLGASHWDILFNQYTRESGLSTKSIAKLKIAISQYTSF